MCIRDRIRLAYHEAPEDFRMRFLMQTFTYGIIDSELQQCYEWQDTRIMRTAWYMIYNWRPPSQRLHGQILKCTLKDRHGTDDEDEEQGTATQRLAPQNKIRKDGRAKCYRCGKPRHLQRDGWSRVQQQGNEQ